MNEFDSEIILAALKQMEQGMLAIFIQCAVMTILLAIIAIRGNK